MRESPILFSPQMVRAILDGSKTQTRRAVKPQPEVAQLLSHSGWGAWHNERGQTLRNPYGQPGDRLWVREAVWIPRATTAQDLREGADTWPDFIYSADADATSVERMRERSWKQRPSIHMPRSASRITLEITGVGVQRLHEITTDDIKAEGVRIPVDAESGNVLVDISTPNGPSAFLTRDQFQDADALLRAHWAALWCAINGRASWDADPWVWAVQFARI